MIKEDEREKVKDQLNEMKNVNLNRFGGFERKKTLKLQPNELERARKEDKNADNQKHDKTRSRARTRRTMARTKEIKATKKLH